MGLSNNLGKLSNMITSTGSAVGIAQPSPAYTLDVSGTLRSTTSAYFATTSGNIGIGTASPVSTNLVGSQTIVKSYNSDTPTSTTAQTYYTNQSSLYLFGRNSGLSIISNNSEEGSIIFGNASTVAYASINTGSGTSSVGGDMYFKVGSNTERMRITSAGNVGIGTASPRTNLSVTVGTTPTSIPTLGTANQGFAITNDSNTYGVNIGTLNTGNTFIQAMRFDSTATAYSILLNPSGGNVGIGTTSPSTHLQVKSNVWSFFAEKQHGSNANFCSINFNGATGSAIIQIANTSYKPGQDTYAGCLTIFVYTTNGTTINVNTISTYGTSYIGTSVSSGVLYIYFSYAGPVTNYSNASVTINGTGNQNSNAPLTVTML